MNTKWILTAVVLSSIMLGGTAEAGSLKGEQPEAKAGKTAVYRPARADSANTTPAAKDAMKLSGVRWRGPVINVGLLSGQAEVKIKCLADSEARIDDKIWESYKKGQILTVTRSGDQIAINGEKKKGTVYLMTKGDEAAFSVKGNSYRGAIKLLPSAYSSGITVVNAVPIEEYLLGVVPSEVSPSWHEDALKAQAVAARTYAMYHMGGFSKAGYDVTDDTRSQVYRGTAVESAATSNAIAETAGEILTSGGKPIDAVFHANGGGYTENSENVWGSQIQYLRGVKEESSSVVNQPWTKTVSLAEFQKLLNVGNLKKIELSKLKKGPMKVRDRGVSGRVKSFTVEGSKGKKTVTGDQMKSWFGLSSTLFDLDVKGKNLVITGYGSGHGLGLSQWGAEAMAAKNGDGKEYYKKILTHYFTGAKVEKIY